MPNYKLTYFNIRGRAETSRYLFSMAGVIYENNTVEGAQWMELKPKTPFGQLPILEVDGRVICQSHVIERYLARQFGLDGKTDWDKARADMVVECMEEFVRPLAHIMSEKDEDKKKESLRKYTEETVPVMYEQFDRMLKDNGRNGEGFFTGDEITFADISFYCGTDTACTFSGQDLSMEKWPALINLKKKVASQPKIIEWNEKRPHSTM